MASKDEESLPMARGSTPIPDPTVLTTKLTEREIAALREILEQKIEGLKNAIETRLNGMDEAHRLLQNTAERLPNRIDEKIEALEKLHDEKFEAVHQRLSGAITNAQTRTEENNKAIQLAREEYHRAHVQLEQAIASQPDAINERIRAASELMLERFKAIEQQFEERDARTDFAFAAAKEIANNQNAASALAIAKSEAAVAKQMDQLQALMQASTRALENKVEDNKERLTRSEGMGQGKQQQLGQWIAVAGVVIAAAVLISRFAH